MSTTDKTERIAFLDGLTPETYPNSPDLETFIWDLEYYSNQDNFTGITKDRHHMIWSRLEIPLAVSDAGVSNATSQMATLRNDIESEVEALLTGFSLADDDKWFEIASVFATTGSNGTVLSIVVGGGTNLDLCVAQGSCPLAHEDLQSFYTSFILCNGTTGDFRHFDSGGCSDDILSKTLKFATGAVAIDASSPLNPPSRTPFSCNPIDPSQYFQFVRPLNNIRFELSSTPVDYRVGPDVTCTRDFLIYFASECDTDCDGNSDLTCISQSDFSEFFLPNANEVISLDRQLLGADAKFFAYSVYDGISQQQCQFEPNGDFFTTYSTLVEAQYIYD